MSEGGSQRLATFSPTGLQVAFVRDNNLFIHDIRFGSERQITRDAVSYTHLDVYKRQHIPHRHTLERRHSFDTDPRCPVFHFQTQGTLSGIFPW